MTVFDGCSDSCGWTAALIALFAAGTYGVPIKETTRNSNLPIDFNPLIFQTFKTAVFFVMAATPVLFLGVPCRFTPWGILSGLLWVLGGTGGVVAVRLAGLAVAVGTWASVMIGVNFFWGILVFREPVANLRHTVAAFCLLGVGLVGMSAYGAPPSSPTPSTTLSSTTSNSTTATATTLSSDFHDHEGVGDKSSNKRESAGDSISCSSVNNNNNADEEQLESDERVSLLKTNQSVKFRRQTGVSKNDDCEGLLDNSCTRLETIEIDGVPVSMSSSLLPFNSETHVQFGGVIFRKRAAGILAALANGFFSGSSLIPMHYAKRQQNGGGLAGANYMVSYASGAVLSNACLWIIYYAVLLLRLHRKHGDEVSWQTKCKQAAGHMPEWHFQQLWKPALAAGRYTYMHLYLHAVYTHPAFAHS